MFFRPRVLALASAVAMIMPMTATLGAGVDPTPTGGASKLGNTDVYRGGRYNPALNLPGSSSRAVALCMRAAQAGVEKFGRVSAVDVTEIRTVRHGFDIDGSVIVTKASAGDVSSGIFTCLIRRDVVTQWRLSKWQRAAN